MANILVVEDDSPKLAAVITALESVEGCDSGSIDVARDALEAKRFFKSRRYDLVIMDLSLPERRDLGPAPDGGRKLVEEVLNRDVYLRPREIVGLTAYSEVLERSREFFANDLWTVVLYDPTSTSWREQLQRKVRHVLSADVQLPLIGSYSCDLLVIAALEDPELSAVLRIPWGWSKGTASGLPHHHEGSFSTSDGEKRRVVAMSCPRMGMPTAAALAASAIAQLRPRYVCMVGICAGVRGQCELGDILVADPSWDYGCGKWQVSDGEAEFAQAPHQISIDSSTRGRLARFASNSGPLGIFHRDWPAAKPSKPPSVLIGAIASGAAVVADKNYADFIGDQHRKLLGIDMEIYGVMVAAFEASEPTPRWFAMKAVCDFADELKDDSRREYAAHGCASALRSFSEEYLFPRT